MKTGTTPPLSNPRGLFRGSKPPIHTVFLLGALRASLTTPIHTPLRLWPPCASKCIHRSLQTTRTKNWFSDFCFRKRTLLISERSTLSVMWTLALWSVSSKVSSFCTFPLDTAKTHIQLSPTSRGVIEATKKIVTKEGPTG